MTDIDFFRNLSNPKRQNDVLNQLYKKPKKDNRINMPTFEYCPKDFSHQADLLFLPSDKGFQYLLVVVDQGTRLCDAIPLKSKTSEVVLSAIKQIYDKRNILKWPKMLTVDSGSEFKGVFAKEMGKKKIRMKVALVGRHRQVALAEAKNKTIGTMIHKRILQDEKKTGHASSTWVKYLPSILQVVNETAENNNAIRKKQPVNLMELFPRASGDSRYLLHMGDKVRVMLDVPEGYLEGNKLHGKFRNGDIRWSKDVKTVKYIFLIPNQPPMYKLDGVPNVLYTKNQLQLVNEEPEKIEPVAENDENRFEVEKILERKKSGRSFQYLIKWRGYPKSEATWEKKSELMKDIPQLVEKFDKKIEK